MLMFKINMHYYYRVQHYMLYEPHKYFSNFKAYKALWLNDDSNTGNVCHGTGQQTHSDVVIY